MARPVFSWREKVEKIQGKINEDLGTYRPDSWLFQERLSDFLYQLVEQVEKEVSDTYLDQAIEATRESTQENMNFIGYILRGDVQIKHRDEE